ncbi:MAG: hypothetical protein HY549_13060 [Elusimicrobia bacterium]|nr:hypothetical protein [Elusimicrobiota bacterium]
MEKRLLLQIESAFAKAAKALEPSKKLRSTAHALLESLGDAMHCKWGTFWLVDSRLGRLVPIAIWDAVTPPARQLDRHTEDRMLSISERTAGHVWRTGKPVWTTDLVRDMCLPCSLDAKTAGLTGGIWFALKTSLKNSVGRLPPTEAA